MLQQHGLDIWYVGPALKHYRNCTGWVIETMPIIKLETVDWSETKVRHPTASRTDIVVTVSRNLITALQNPATELPLTKMDSNIQNELKKRADIFTAVTEAPPKI